MKSRLNANAPRPDDAQEVHMRCARLNESSCHLSSAARVRLLVRDRTRHDAKLHVSDSQHQRCTADPNSEEIRRPLSASCRQRKNARVSPRRCSRQPTAVIRDLSWAAEASLSKHRRRSLSDAIAEVKDSLASRDAPDLTSAADDHLTNDLRQI